MNSKVVEKMSYISMNVIYFDELWKSYPRVHPLSSFMEQGCKNLTIHNGPIPGRRRARTVQPCGG